MVISVLIVFSPSLVLNAGVITPQYWSNKAKVLE